MLTQAQLAEIHKRWIDGDIPAGRRIACAEQDIPALLETVSELKSLMKTYMHLWGIRPNSEIEEALK
jgi:hypothetical protein